MRPKDFDQFLLEYSSNNDIVFSSTFTTRIKEDDVDVENIEAVVLHDDYNINTTISPATVVWSLDPDMNEQGISSMGLMIKSVTASIEWSFDDGEGNTDEGVIEFNKKSIDSDWQIISEVNFEPDGGVYPTHVEIDFKTNKVTVS